MSDLLDAARISDVAARTRSMLAVVVAGIAGFAALTAVIRRREVDAIDHAITVRVQAMRQQAIERAMGVVSWFGFAPQSRLLPPAYAAILWILRYRLEAVFQLAAWGTAPLASVIKWFVRRPRPVGGRTSASPPHR